MAGLSTSSDARCPRCGFDPVVSEGSPSEHAPLTSLSEVQALLRSNDSPSPLDFASLTARRSAASSRLREISQQVYLLGITLEQLKEEANVLQEDESSYERILHPLRRLPTEILSDIICLATGSEFDARETWPPVQASNMRTHVSESQLPPWTLSQVCSRWRRVTISYSRLWSYISLDFKDRGSASEAFLLNRRLQRSSDQPITLRMDATHVEPESFSHSLLLSVVSHSERWIEVHMALSQKSFSMCSSVKGALSRLRMLSLSIPSGLDPDDRELDMFLYAPQLRELILRGDHAVVQRIRLPWTQIIHFSWLGNEVNNGTAVALLSKMPHLEDCSLDVCRTPDDVVSSTGSLRLPFLTRLALGSFSGQSHDSLSQILDFIICPSLKILELHYDLAQSSLETLSRFIQSSQCTLDHISLPELRMDRASAIAFLQELPLSITTLALKSKSGSISEVTINLLRCSPGGSVILPQLRNLYISGRTKFVSSTLLDVIESRLQESISSPDVRPLARVSLSGWYSKIQQGLILNDPRTLALRQSGLDFDVNLYTRGGQSRR